jgi:hypothetical protein
MSCIIMGKETITAVFRRASNILTRHRSPPPSAYHRISTLTLPTQLPSVHNVLANYHLFPPKLQPHAPSSRPFEFLHADIGEDDGRHFLVIIYQFSGWPHVTMFQKKNTTPGRLIEAFLIATGRAPVKLWKDNVPF